VSELSVHDITVRVTSLLLPKISARVLLANPEAVCFAAGCDADGMSNEELCRRVVEGLQVANADYYERHMAVIAAAVMKRYDEMVKAMNEANLEPVIIEDLV
jgi:hypothetical protein